jgi:hypothetical protein
MLEFFKRLFGSKPAEPTPAPYKVEKPAEFPFPSAKSTKSEKKLVAKKPVEKKPSARRPRKPRKPAAPKV